MHLNQTDRSRKTADGLRARHAGFLRFLAGEGSETDTPFRFRVLAAITITCLYCVTVQAAPIFTENFQSYALGSNLAGQGGWLGDGSLIEDGTGNGLTSRVAARPAGGSNPERTYHTLPAFSESLNYTLSFDAFAASNAHNHSLGLERQAAEFADSLILFNTDTVADEWQFVLREANGSTTASVNTGVSTGSTLSLVFDIDGPNLTARGQIQPLGGGAPLYDSGFLAVSSTWLANLDSVVLSFNNSAGQFHGPAQFDNLVLNAVPEPASVALGLLALCSLAAGRRPEPTKPISNPF